MAENELLDLSNPFIYRKWRKILLSDAATPKDAAEALYSDFSDALRNAIRQEPLSRVFLACGEDRVALQAAVIACKDRALARKIEQACKIEKSGCPDAVARALANLLISSIVDQCNRQTLSLLTPLSREGHQAIESAALMRLEASRQDIVGWLSAALEGRGSDVPKPSRPRKPSSDELLNISLIPTFSKIKKGSHHA